MPDNIENSMEPQSLRMEPRVAKEATPSVIALADLKIEGLEKKELNLLRALKHMEKELL